MIYLARHGLRLDKVSREHRKKHRFDPNPPIHHSGIQWILDQSKKIDHLDVIFCSPFLRCVQTAHYLNRHEAPIKIDNGPSEVMKHKWFDHCGYNPLARLHSVGEYKRHYHTVDDSYTSRVPQKFPESRGDCRGRVYEFMRWLE